MKEKKIATNKSSGAEKVEIIERKKQNGAKTMLKATVKTEKQTAKGEAAMGGETQKTERISAKKINTESAGSKAEQESKAAKERVERALEKKKTLAEKKEERMKLAAERKEKRAKLIAEKKAEIEKRTAERKAAIEKRAAEKKAQTERKKAEKEEKLRQRAHEKANKKNAAAKRRAERKKQNNRERKERNQGYGGWLAAVIALGAVTLGLTTAVTVGAVEMANTKAAMLSANKGTMYELTGIMEHVDDDLDRVRISASPAQQSRILTDLLVQARLAEADMEKMPISMEQSANVTTFVNRVGMECERMLHKLRKGGELDEQDKQTIENLYMVNHSIRTELDKLMAEMTDKDWTNFMKKGEGMMSDVMNKLEKMTLEENRAAFDKNHENKQAGMSRDMAPPPEKEEKSGIDCKKAESLCERYFKEYNIEGFQCVGETNSKTFAAYNVQGYDKNGSLLFAEISKSDGALISFDYYEECTSETFDIKNAETIAENFLEMLGYDDMEVVKFRNSGTTTDFTFVYEDDDVIYYPDEIRVKVCRTRGLVSGMDAGKYLKNHKDREEPTIKVTLEKAQEGLYDGLTVEASRLAVVRAKGGERPAYEFFCSYKDEQYFVYVDANSGEELSIVNAKSVE